MKVLVVILVCLSVASSLYASSAESDELTVKSFSNDPPAVIWMECSWGRAASAGRRVVLYKAVWPDGRLVEKSNGVTNVWRYICKSSVSNMLVDIEGTGVFDTNRLARVSYFGFDAYYWVLEVRAGGKARRLESWHNLMEEDKRLIVIDGCVKRRPFFPFGRAYRNSPDYERFLSVWDAILERIRKL